MVDYVRSMGIESIDEVPKLKKKYQKLTTYFQQHYSLELDHFLQLIRFDYLMKEELFKGVPIEEAYLKHNYCLDSAKHYLLNTDTWGVYELRLFARSNFDGASFALALLDDRHQKESALCKNSWQ